MAERSDAELVEAAQGGNREALETLLGKYQPRVFRFGLKMCRNPDDAGDITQETLITMTRALGEFRGASSVSTWLYTIARRFCLKKRRRRKGEPDEKEPLESISAGSSSVADPARPPDEEVAGLQLQRTLEAAIAGLPAIYREVLVLRDVEGLTAPEVAEVTGLTIEAIKSRLHRARLMVREKVAPVLMIPPGLKAPGRCPDVLTLFSKHVEGEIDGSVCARMEAHLRACAHCHSSCESLKRTLAMCRQTNLPRVPDAIQESIRTSIRSALGVSGL
jgi:RNA polymerase sigma-70 factor (ECF subfamily)